MIRGVLILASMYDISSCDRAMGMVSQMVDAEEDGQNAKKDQREVHCDGMDDSENCLRLMPFKYAVTFIR